MEVSGNSTAKPGQDVEGIPFDWPMPPRRNHNRHLFLLEAVNQTISPWTFAIRFKMLVWEIAWNLFCRWTPKPLNPWRCLWLKRFGATIEGHAFVHQRARIEMPWNLTLLQNACVGDGAILYSQGRIALGRDCVISQGAHLCAGTHDYHDPAFPLITKPIVVEDHVWVAAEAFIHPGVTLAEGCVIGARSVVTKDTEPWTVYSGFPAKKIRERRRILAGQESE